MQQQKIPMVGSLVDGITFEPPTFYTDNPAKDERFHHYFLTGWHELIITNTGTNPFFPNEGQWRACILWSTQDTPFRLECENETGFVCLLAGDTIEGVTVSEESLPGPQRPIFGLWFNVFFQRPGENKKRTSLLFTPIGANCSSPTMN